MSQKLKVAVIGATGMVGQRRHILTTIPGLKLQN